MHGQRGYNRAAPPAEGEFALTLPDPPPLKLRRPAKVAEDDGRGNDYHLGVKDLPLDMRPRERLIERGARELPDAELLAIILRTGTTQLNVIEVATRLLVENGGLSGVDAASISQLGKSPGLGPVKAAEIKAALELGRRVVSIDPTRRSQIRSPLDIANLMHPDMSSLEQESLRIMLLDTKNKVIAVPELYRGTLNGTTVRVGELFKEAIRQTAASVVLVHNHPSGDPTPSAQDVQLTRDAIRAGQLLDIEVLDHVIIGKGGQRAWVSLKELRLAFTPDPAVRA